MVKYILCRYMHVYMMILSDDSLSLCFISFISYIIIVSDCELCYCVYSMIHCDLLVLINTEEIREIPYRQNTPRTRLVCMQVGFNLFHLLTSGFSWELLLSSLRKMKITICVKRIIISTCLLVIHLQAKVLNAEDMLMK